MAKSAALNPASMPFFPGGSRPSDEEDRLSIGFSLSGAREQDRAFMSSVSLSPSDRPSVKSSPSPSSEGVDNIHDAGARPYPSFDSVAREPSISSSLDAASATDEMTYHSISENGSSLPMSGPPTLRQSTTPSIGIQNRSRSPYANNAVVPSSSPVSSLSSGGQFTSNIDFSPSFEVQLRSSPIINDVLERLVRCEISTREIHRNLNDVHRKVDLLLERSMGFSSQPEFKDPFAPGSSSGGLSGLPPQGIARLSVSGNIAPNQQSSDDIIQISQRLNTLTSSVGQLLALQTQQHMQSVGPSLGSSHITSSQDVPPNQLLTPLALSGNVLNHGLPNRPELRASRTPNPPPMRTWSAGSLDLPVRPSDNLSVLRGTDTLRDNKRRSVSGLVRRDSAGVDVLGGPPSRDSTGPALSKWDQLSLASELLNSLTKFGVGPPNKIQQRALPFLLKGADIIAQAPPTQERIAAYVIPAIHVALAQRMIRDIGGPIGIRSALGVGSAFSTSDLTQELRLLQQNTPHIICGTPQKLHALFTASGGLVGSQVRFLVLDEVDQLIARNLQDFIFNIVKLLPPPRSRPLSNPSGNASQTSLSSSDANSSFQSLGRRYSAVGTPPTPSDMSAPGLPQQIERQTALFSNTVPQDVLNLATAIQLREPVRVLVRRDGNPGRAGLRQFYLYLAFTAGGRSEAQGLVSGDGLGIIGSGRGLSNAETQQAREWKLDALGDLFEDVESGQAIVHVGGLNSLDSVVYKLASRGLEPIPLHGDMNAATKLAALNRFRNTPAGMMRQSATKVLVVYDVQVKNPEVPHVPLIINYDLPKAVEEYAHRVAPAIAPSHSRAGVVVNFVTATGGDVEMLRSIECFYKIKCPEVPMSLRHIV
ncbi:hypothetical protein EI94DRAFT_1777336 [Lactarius quietus]|nr:hypothetical protein EI94DRAFT_1777336 [Lactarius quietus]